MREVDVLIDMVSQDLARVRWTIRLDGELLGVRREIEEALDELDGIEHVSMGRYQAFVRIADHIQPSIKEVLESLAAVFREPAVVEAPGIRLHKVTFRKVTVTAKKIRLV